MSDGDLLNSYLTERDIACPSCGYNLRGLVSESCPECRQSLALSLTLKKPAFWQWLLTIIPLWIVGGILSLWIAILMFIYWGKIFAILFRQGRWLEVEILMLVVYPAVAAMLLIPCAYWFTSTRGRKWFTTNPRRNRICNICLGISITLPVVWIAWFVLTV